MIEKINLYQKNILLIPAAVILISFIFLSAVYLSAKNKIYALKSTFKETEEKIQKIEKIIDQNQSAGEGIRLLQERNQQIDMKFPSKEEEGLGRLTNIARQLNIDVVSIRPQPKIDFLDAANQKVVVKGKTCQQFFVSLEMKGSYRELVAYIEALKKDLQTLFIIEKLNIKKEVHPSQLNITVGINLYLLS